MKSIRVEVLGVPMAKQSSRFRIVKSNGNMFVKSYQKKEIVDKEDNISYAVMKKLGSDFVPFDCPVKVEVDFIFPVPKSIRKDQRLLISSGFIVYKTSRPDVDNITKLVMDSLNGVVFTDDSRVVDLRLKKYYGAIPKTIISVTPIN